MDNFAIVAALRFLRRHLCLSIGGVFLLFGACAATPQSTSPAIDSTSLLSRASWLNHLDGPLQQQRALWTKRCRASATLQQRLWPKKHHYCFGNALVELKQDANAVAADWDFEQVVVHGNEALRLCVRPVHTVLRDYVGGVTDSQRNRFVRRVLAASEGCIFDFADPTAPPSFTERWECTDGVCLPRLPEVGLLPVEPSRLSDALRQRLVGRIDRLWGTYSIPYAQAIWWLANTRKPLPAAFSSMLGASQPKLRRPFNYPQVDRAAWTAYRQRYGRSVLLRRM